MTQPGRNAISRSVDAAVRSIVEPLEGRQLMHAGHDHGDGLETLRIDAGATAPYTDSLGRVWTADAGFTGGGVDTKSFAVAGTADPKLYTSRRAGEFGYSAPAADGNYTLNLLFADWVTTAGTRKFNVDAEGQRILANFDVAASGGGQRALIKSFPITVTGGMFDLAFTKVVGNPVVSAIELVPLNTPTPTPVAPAAPTELQARALSSSRVGLNWVDNANNETGFEIERSLNGVNFAPVGTAGVGATSWTDTTAAVSTHYVYRVRAVNGAGESAWTNVADATTPAPPSGPGNAGTIIRVDAGATGPYTDGGGSVWSKDDGFVGGGLNTGTFAVSGTAEDALFATRRTGAFTYSRAVPNGEYTLRLLFTDYYAAGARVFNVDVEADRVLTNHDIAAQVGANAMQIKSFTVNVADGTFNMAFSNVKGNATLSGFELIANAPEVVPAAPTNLAAVPGNGRISLSWQDNSLNERSFQIWRSVNGGAFELLATRNMEQTAYEDAGLDPAKTYGYYVRAVNPAGNSDPSNTASAQPLAGAPVDTWTKITWSTQAAGPIGRAEALHAVVDGKLYVFAGFSGNNGPVTRSDVYNPATNSWTRIADHPRRLTHAGVATEGRDVYFAGGYIGTGPGYQQQFGTEEVWRYNVDDNAYTAMPNLPAKLAGGGLVAVGRNLHYFGGNNSSRQDVGVHYVLNLDNPAAGWVAKQSMITARSHMGFVNVGGKIYAIGGQKGNDENLVAQKVVEVYDPATNTWAAKTSMPKGVNHISSATFVMGGRILTLGGQTSHGSAIADAYAYDPAADKWVSLTPLPASRFSGVAAAINGTIYFTSGSSQTTTWKGIVG